MAWFRRTMREHLQVTGRLGKPSRGLEFARGLLLSVEFVECDRCCLMRVWLQIGIDASGGVRDHETRDLEGELRGDPRCEPRSRRRSWRRGGDRA